MGRATETSRTGLYVEPCTYCPLHCALCYTRHDRQALVPEETIARMVEVMLEGLPTLGIFWCGLGELYADPRFPGLIAGLDARHGPRLLHHVQTNGQYPERPLLPHPETKLLLVSIDLPRAFSAAHRGPGSYERAVAYLGRHLAAGVAGALVKCLLTKATLPHVASGFAALLADLALASGLRRPAVAELVRLAPVLPFDRRATAAVGAPSIRANAFDEAPEELLALAVRHLPEAARELAERPRTLEVALTTDGLFNCCEAVVPIGTHAELPALTYAELMRRLEASVPGCEGCALRDVC